MSLSIGIVGLPNVGKSTLFNALTKKGVPAENYPFCTIDPAVGIVAVPDARLEKLTTFSQSAKVIPAAIEFVDIAGLVKGAAGGAGLGNQFLAHIREVDAIVEVVRVFSATGGSAGGGEVVHVYQTVDPLRDVEIINLELILADLQAVTKRQASIARDVKRGDKEAVIENALLQKIKTTLDAGQLVSTRSFNAEELIILKTWQLLTAKPILYVLNKMSGSATIDTAKLLNFFQTTGAKSVEVDVKIEDELKQLSAVDQAVFKKELGVTDDGVNNLIRAAYDLLGLITFFTTGADETRAWTIKRGTNAKEAGAAIHTDFHDKFIRAEVINWQDLLNGGLTRTEGKEYIVKDGDVIEFKI